MLELRFFFRGDLYRVNQQGHINANGIGHFSPEWIFVGGSKHHWRMGIDVSLKAAFENPKLLNGCFGWDIDHGTRRTWRGSYYGKPPRISDAFVIDTSKMIHPMSGHYGPDGVGR